MATRPVDAACPLCTGDGGRVIWADDDWRVVAAGEEDFPAFYRLIAVGHVAEFSSLEPRDRDRCMGLVAAIESAVVDAVTPTKMNLASLGNVVPHLHWHVIARFDWDSRYPDPVWAPVRRSVDPAPAARIGAGLVDLDDRVRAALVACQAG